MPNQKNQRHEKFSSNIKVMDADVSKVDLKNKQPQAKIMLNLSGLGK